MALSSGTRLGPYEVLSPLGAGGMGEVYLARDTRLGRDVAVKVLPDSVANDPSALTRFEREARAVAALSHPNLLALHDVGEASGIRFLVTELLQGETLRVALRDGALPVKRALEIAEQVARGLAAAHENGIVHRDLKPENVFLARDGHVKILDFGLARRDGLLRDASDTRSPTASVPTAAGAVVGTIAYMSPEQAKGQPVGLASDQFSLGIVLYEMLAGLRPFRGASGAETLTAIIREEPEPLEKVAPAVPAAVRWIVERCLHKDAAERYDSTRDLARDLAQVRTHLGGQSERAAGGGGRPRGIRLALTGLALSFVGIVTLASLLVLERGRAGPASPHRFEIRLPQGHYVGPDEKGIALSPDGKLLAYSAFSWKKPCEEPNEAPLMIRPLDALDAFPIAGTTSAFSQNPVFSPDGQHVAYTDLVDGKPVLRSVPVRGGTIRTICACDATFGAAWSPDGSILFASERGPLQRVPASGGTPEPVTTLDAAAAEISHRLPSLLPDGRTVLFTALRWATTGMTWEKARIFAQHLGSSERALLVEGGSDGRWAPPGHLVFAREGKILAAPLDADMLRLAAAPVPFLEGVRHAVWSGNARKEIGAAQVAGTASGLLAWVPGSVNPPMVFTRSWFDGLGKETPLEETRNSGPILSGRVSLDGRKVLLSYSYPGMQAEVLDLARGARQPATVEMNPRFAIWGPGPDRITFRSDHEGPLAFYTQRPGAGPEDVRLLWKPADGAMTGLGSWSRDGKVLAFVRISPETREDIWLLEDGKAPRPFLATRLREAWVDISPDGQWLLYSSGEQGHPEVFVKPLSGEGDAIQVSVTGGREALWSRDGSAILFWKFVEKPGPREALYRVRVTRIAGSLDFGRPEKLFETSRGESWPGHSWDVAPDGRYLVGVYSPEAQTTFWGKVLSNRIVVDTGGVAHLLGDAKQGP